MTNGIGDILNKLKKVKAFQKGEFQACCPAHEDKQPSLNLRQEGDTILIKCQAGCTTESIVYELGLEMKDLFVSKDAPIPTPAIPPKIVATYDYQDEKGQLLYQVIRYQPKNFRQRHKNGTGEWIWDMEGVLRVLYHLPELINATDPVYLVEGEKDADNLWANGKIATTSPGGANSWKPEYANFLKGKKVIVIPDKDSAGYSYAKDVIRSLENKASDIKIVILPGDSKDVSDWLETGADVEELVSLEQDPSILLDPDKPTYQQKDDIISWRKSVNDRFVLFEAEKLSEERTGIHARISIKCDYTPLAWSYFNVERSEDRTRLANSAHKQLKGDITKQYSSEDLRHDLDSFCNGLWPFHVSQFVPELMDGDETMS